MIATTANGQPAAAVYNRDADGVLRAHGIVVLAPTATGVSSVVEFHDPALVVMFGFPEMLGDVEVRTPANELSTPTELSTTGW
jgi:RNA polymerase sigma-70 factor (ECF subfamily)